MINNYTNYLNHLKHDVKAELRTQKRKIIVYPKDIIVFKRIGCYNVVLETFIRFADIKACSFTNTRKGKCYMLLKLIRRPGIKSDHIKISLNKAESMSDLCEFIYKVNAAIEERNGIEHHFSTEWDNESILAQKDFDDGEFYEERDSDSEERLKTIISGGETWQDYLKRTNKNLAANRKFRDCDGNPEKIAEIGEEYLKHYEEDKDFFEEIAESPEKLADLGYTSKEELEEQLKNNPEALECFRLAAHSGNLRAALGLGKCYLYGLSTEVNYDYAMYWLCKAADAYGEARKLIAECVQQKRDAKKSCPKQTAPETQANPSEEDSEETEEED